MFCIIKLKYNLTFVTLIVLEGGVENINGLIREYLPKGINLDTVTDLEIQEIEDRLNNRPRKKLNYLTPNEVITIELEKRGFHS